MRASDLEEVSKLFGLLADKDIPGNAIIELADDINLSPDGLIARINIRGNKTVAYMTETWQKVFFFRSCDRCQDEFHTDDFDSYKCDDCNQKEYDEELEQVKDAATKGGFHD